MEDRYRLVMRWGEEDRGTVLGFFDNREGAYSVMERIHTQFPTLEYKVQKKVDQP